MGGVSGPGFLAAIQGIGFSIPLPAFGHVFGGFEFLGVILVTAIPFGIYDLVEAMDNVESAEVAGDAYPTTRVLTADGAVSLIGCMMGNPFINAVYIGHPGWKAMGGRIGYSVATGLVILALCWLNLVSLLSSLVPVVAIAPILLYIGMLIGAQAFQETPHSHAPAIVLAFAPHLAAWAQDPRGRRAGRGGHQRGGGGARQARTGGRALWRARSARRGRDPGWADPRRHRGLHHRARFRQGGGFLGRRGGDDLFRLHAWPRGRNPR